MSVVVRIGKAEELRFKMEEDTSKQRINLSIDAGVLSSIKDKGMNISGLCEAHLKDIILTFEKQTLPTNCKHKWTFPFCTTFGLAKECLKCRHIKRVVVEGSAEEKMLKEQIHALKNGLPNPEKQNDRL